MNASFAIDRLRISLPPEWRGKETLLVHLIARELGKLPIHSGANLDQVKIPLITVRPGETAAFLASCIANQIHGQIQIASSGTQPTPVPKANYA